MYLIIVEIGIGNGKEGETFKQLKFISDKDVALEIAEEATAENRTSVHLIHFPDGMSGNEVSLWQDGMVELERGGETLYISFDGEVEPNE